MVNFVDEGVMSWLVKEKRKVKRKVIKMAKFVDGKDPGKLAMSGKTFLGKPRNTISSKSGSISKQDSRGKGQVKFK